MNLNTIVSLILFGVSLVIPLVQIALSLDRLPLSVIAQLILKYALFFNVGCLFITGFAGQFLYGPEIASCIGWGWSPFQYELAFSELSLAILGLCAALFKREFQLATIISAVVWLLGASAVHLWYLIVEHNKAILNAQFVIGWNIFIALFLIALYVIAYRPFNKVYKSLFS